MSQILNLESIEGGVIQRVKYTENVLVVWFFDGKYAVFALDYDGDLFFHDTQFNTDITEWNNKELVELGFITEKERLDFLNEHMKDSLAAIDKIEYEKYLKLKAKYEPK